MAYRDRERERRARAQLALDPDSSAVQLDELPAQGEPEPGALYLLVSRPHLTELLEHRLLILGGDADAGIADGDFDQSVLCYSYDLDASAFGRELDGIRQQVQDDLADLPLVGPHLTQPLVNVHVQRDTPSSRPLTDKCQGAVERRGEMEVR